MKKSYLIIFVFILLIFLGAGFLLGRNISGKNSNQTYQEGWNAMRDRVIKSGELQQEDRAYSFLGDVYKKTDTELYIKLAYADPLLPADLDNRVAKVVSSTAIYTMAAKENSQYQQEMTEYIKSHPNRGPDNEDGAPIMFVKETKTFNDISVGQRITVKASENIKTKKDFIAEEVIIQ